MNEAGQNYRLRICHFPTCPLSFTVRAMRPFSLFLAVLFLGWSNLAAPAATPKVSKVLPQYLDREGRHALSPSLFDRDAYQAHLRRTPEERSGIRFAIYWKGRVSAPSKLRVEMRGSHGKEPTTATLEEPVRRRGLFGSWSSIALTGPDYKNFGELAAWRVTLWSGNQQVAEQKSFLW